MSVSSQAHGVVIPIPYWGHFRPIFQLCGNLLSTHPDLCLTFLLHPKIEHSFSQELDSPFMSHIREDPIRKRLKALVVDGDSQEIETSKGQDGGDPFQMALPAFLAMVWNVDRQKEVPDQDGPDAGFVITDLLSYASYQFGDSQDGGKTEMVKLEMREEMMTGASEEDAMAKRTRARMSELASHILSKPVLEAGIQPPRVTNEISDAVMYFLDDNLRRKGKRTVAFVSFVLNSDPWPTDRPELVGYLLQGIREARVPLIFACAPPSAPFLPKLKDAFGEDRDVLFVDWAPQWQILAHEAVGFMVTHCGHNGTSEAIMNRIPLLTIPFNGDQPILSANLCQVQGVGIELAQFKSFASGLEKPVALYRGVLVEGTERAIQVELRDAIIRIMGDEGNAMREKMSVVREVCAKSRDEGVGRKVMNELSRFFF
ncbi:MAG: hypothetical protein TREMPRED_003264 [Tremellales sp. Tagirdzhanova-0007]|nr:MAG: hypothetical protein TREMPRED_003264 [Tremellales sp. Tagirdzhanova-0007]